MTCYCYHHFNIYIHLRNKTQDLQSIQLKSKLRLTLSTKRTYFLKTFTPHAIFYYIEYIQKIHFYNPEIPRLLNKNKIP